MTSPDITVELDWRTIIIKFGGKMHVWLDKSKILGVQSWRNAVGDYCIEYTLIGGNLLTEYNDIEKFNTILDGLEKIL